MKKALLISILTTFGISLVAQNPSRMERREQRAGGGVVRTERGVDDPAAHAILNDVRKNLKSYKSLKIDFTFLTENRNDKTKNTIEKGTILLRGDKYNLNFMGLNAISDGKTVWNFNSETKEVHISQANPKDMETLNPLVLLDTYDKNFRAKLIREEVENSVSVAIIDLQPFENRSFHKVRIVMDKAKRAIVRTEIHEKNSTIMTFRVDKMQTNPPAPDSEFRFDVSKHSGVEVVDMR